MMNLHSNMDRLKQRSLALDQKFENHLHSNMDRLKRPPHTGRLALPFIYIPIWID